MKQGIKEWSTIFRGLGNQNRLRILQILEHDSPKSVTELSEILEISFKNTSRNLGILLNLGFLEFEGKKDRVYYSLNNRLAEDVKKILSASIF